MPMYEYRCAECDKHVEAIQKFSDPPLTDCPSCGAPHLQRLLSQSTFALKGGGWYADGYGGGKKDGAEAANTESDKKSSDDAKPKANDTADAKSKASNG
jgi:putative FmdB family regulatory protein